MYFLKKKIGKEHVDLVDKNQRTALHWAASIGAADYVELLLKIGANANLPDAEGKLPLHWALSLQKSQNENDKVWTFLHFLPIFWYNLLRFVGCFSPEYTLQMTLLRIKGSYKKLLSI